MTLPHETVKKITHDSASRYCRDVFGHELTLTQEDINRCVASHANSTNLLWEVYQASQHVADFIKLGDYLRWAHLGAELVSCFMPEGIRLDFTSRVDYEVTDEKTGRKTYGTDTVEQTIEWAELDEAFEEARQLVLAWYAQTPYRIWILVEGVIEKAIDELREGAYPMADGRQMDVSISQTMETGYQEAVEKWVKGRAVV